MAAAARAGVESTTMTAARRGRAAWVGERGAGSPDAGATAWLRFLEHLQESWAEAADSFTQDTQRSGSTR
jgi:dihydroxyacetone kinase